MKGSKEKDTIIEELRKRIKELEEVLNDKIR